MYGYAIKIFVLIAVILFGTWLYSSPPEVVSEQIGYRGVAMEVVRDSAAVTTLAAANQVPEALPPEDDSGPRASEIYENVQVLGHLNEANFLRIMTAITEWVSPEQGCTYCHSEDGNFASDDIYTKVVSRRMLQMTQHINAEWKDHIAQTGVTCYTCHRGQPVPANIWFNQDIRPHRPALGNRAGQNAPAPEVALASLPHDIFGPYLLNDRPIRVISTNPLPQGDGASIKAAESTYGLMMHMAESLGVNCSFCHNSRAFADWQQSPPQRTSAWHGIRMARDLNADYLDPLQPVYPPERLGPLGDAPKANCLTCHQGANKPLLGISMLTDYPELNAPGAK